MDKKTQVKRIFDTISPKYDFLNHFLRIDKFLQLIALREVVWSMSKEKRSKRN